MRFVDEFRDAEKAQALAAQIAALCEPGPEVEDGSGVLVDAHGMEPDAVFALLKALGGDIPKLLVVGCEPAEVSERIGLSPPVAGAVDQAVAVVRELIGEHESGEEG